MKFDKTKLAQYLNTSDDHAIDGYDYAAAMLDIEPLAVAPTLAARAYEAMRSRGWIPFGINPDSSAETYGIPVKDRP